MAEDGATFADNDELVDYLVREKLIKSENVERVFRIVDRGNYFPPRNKVNAYKLAAWQCGRLQLSSPDVYSMVMEHLQLSPGLSFLNVGSGTGYLSTMAGLLLGNIGVNHGVEIHADVIVYAQQRLSESKTKIAYPNRSLFCEPVFIKGNGLCLPREIIKYDRVYCGAECPENFVHYLKNLIKVGGILVMPVNNQLLQITRVSLTLWENKSISQVSFAPIQLPTLTDELIPLKLPKACVSFSPRKVIPGSSEQQSPAGHRESEIDNVIKKSQGEVKLCPSCGKDEGETIIKNELLGNLEKTTEHLQELLECPVCLGAMDSSLIQCKNGHGICSDCKKRLENCPICKQEFVVYQNILLGKVLESFPKLCCYSNKGCPVVGSHKDHETFCKFRPASCKSRQCDWSGSVIDLIGHVKTCVKNEACEILPMFGNKVSRYFQADGIENTLYSPVFFNNELFWEVIYNDVEKKFIAFKFYHVATFKPIYSYYFKVSFKKGKVEQVNTSRVFLNEDIEDCGEETGTSIVLTYAELERFQNTKDLGKYEYSLELFLEDFH